jgi:hypothetical protein
VNEPLRAVLKAEFTPHAQDRCGPATIESHVEVTLQGDLERLRWQHPEEKRWHPVFNSDSDAFFMVGYGATRRAEKASRFQLGTQSGERAKRVMGLFEEDYSLRPLNTWLPEMRSTNHGRYTQVLHLINRLMGKSHYLFNGEQDKEGEYVFERGGMKAPFPALSDGYRAYVGWIADLLFHVCHTCPSGEKLVENRGIVMVDEIDLHLHPKWQMTVLPTLAKILPNIQCACPQAVARAGSFRHQRALLTITFFHLDDRNKRRELFRGRADVIQKLGLAFPVRDAAGASAAVRVNCQKIIDCHQSPSAPHTNCGRAYAKLWSDDPLRAQEIWNDAVDFLATISPPRHQG